MGIDKVRVAKGFRFLRPVEAFEYVEHNEVVKNHHKNAPFAFSLLKWSVTQVLAYDEEMGEIRCPFKEGAIVVMPTSQPIIGEEAWFWAARRVG